MIVICVLAVAAALPTLAKATHNLGMIINVVLLLCRLDKSGEIVWVSHYHFGLFKFLRFEGVVPWAR